MPIVKGMIRKVPPSHSRGSYANYDHSVPCSQFIVQKHSEDDGGVQVTIFFPSMDETEQGVGLSLQSLENTIVVGRALVTLAEGNLSELRGNF